MPAFILICAQNLDSCEYLNRGGFLFCQVTQNFKGGKKLFSVLPEWGHATFSKSERDKMRVRSRKMRAPWGEQSHIDARSENWKHGFSVRRKDPRFLTVAALSPAAREKGKLRETSARFDWDHRPEKTDSLGKKSGISYTTGLAQVGFLEHLMQVSSYMLRKSDSLSF